MAPANMEPKLFIFDIYRTLLLFDEANEPDEEAWNAYRTARLGDAPSLSWAEFSTAWSGAVYAAHQSAMASGIDYPEMFGPDLLRSIDPALAPMSDRELTSFHLGLMRKIRQTRLPEGAADFLQRLSSRGILLGIASNSQPYTLDEVVDAGLPLHLFEPDLVYWSHVHGVAKPSPFVFRTLTFHARARGIHPGEILMVGDRADRDTDPAAIHGWQTHLIQPSNPESSWAELFERFGS